MSPDLGIRRLCTGTVFKRMLIGFAGALIPFSLLMGILSLLGASTVTWNDQPLTGLSGLPASPFIGAFIALLFGALAGLLVAAGLWLFSRFRPLRIRYHADDD